MTYQTIDAMERYGGSFVKALGEAYRTADMYNAAKLMDAFPELFEKYGMMAQKMNKREQTKPEPPVHNTPPLRCHEYCKCGGGCE